MHNRAKSNAASHDERSPLGHGEVHGQWRAYLQGRWVVLRPLMPDDMPWLYDLAVARGVGITWRLRGVLPPFPVFAENVTKGTEASFVIQSVESGERVGVTQFIECNFRDQTVALSAVLDPDVQRRAWPVEGLALTVGYAFDMLGFRKLYLTSPESVVAAYRRLTGSLLHEEGRLRQHQRVLDRYEDFVIYAIYARDWDPWRARLGFDVRRRASSAGIEVETRGGR